MGEETVGNVLIFDSSFGGGTRPHYHRWGELSPQTPAIKCIEALFNFHVYNKGSEPIGRKDGQAEPSPHSRWGLCPTNNLFANWKFANRLLLAQIMKVCSRPDFGLWG
jgi:hypothetical protein